MLSEFTARYLFFGLIILSVIFEVAADVLFKKWAIGSRGILLTIGLVLYFIGTVFWAISLKYEFLSKAVSIFTVLNFVAVVLVGFLVFREHISLINKLGVALGIISIILMEL